jgi:hypothetical protein
MSPPCPCGRLARDRGREPPPQQLCFGGLDAFTEFEEAEREAPAPDALARIGLLRARHPLLVLALQVLGKLADLTARQRRQLPAGEDRRGPFVEVDETELRATSDGAQERRVATAASAESQRAGRVFQRQREAGRTRFELSGEPA